MRGAGWDIARSGREAVLTPVPGSDAGAGDEGACLSLLAELYLDGVRNIVPARTATTEASAPDSLRRLAGAVSRLNRLLDSRGLDRLVLSRGRVVAGPDNPRRRTFLTALAPEQDSDDPSALVRLQRLGAGLPDALFRFSPGLAAESCTGCDACIRVCPEAALTLVKDAGGETCYRPVPEACTGCSLCEKVCDVDAIGIVEMSWRMPDIPLVAGVCRSCGAPFHEPEPPVAGNRQCRICRQKDHRKNLFVVLQ